MARYRITTPDGKRTFEVEGPDDATPEELQAFARQQVGVAANYPVENRGPVRAESGGFQDLIMQGASFGFADEAAGAINALIHPLTQGAYAEGRDRIRSKVDDARERLGWSGTLAEIGGGLLGGLPKRGIEALQSLGQAARHGAKAGAIGGGIAGVGNGDGAVDSLIQGAVGSAAGAGLGVGLPIAAGVVSNRAAALSRLIAFVHLLRRQRRVDGGNGAAEHRVEVGVQALLDLGAGQVVHANT